MRILFYQHYPADLAEFTSTLLAKTRIMPEFKRTYPVHDFSGVMSIVSGVLSNIFRSGQIPDLKLIPDDR